jgi:hypothetical protein
VLDITPICPRQSFGWPCALRHVIARRQRHRIAECRLGPGQRGVLQPDCVSTRHSSQVAIHNRTHARAAVPQGGSRWGHFRLRIVTTNGSTPRQRRGSNRRSAADARQLHQHPRPPRCSPIRGGRTRQVEAMARQSVPDKHKGPLRPNQIRKSQNSGVPPRCAHAALPFALARLFRCKARRGAKAVSKPAKTQAFFTIEKS